MLNGKAVIESIEERIQTLKAAQMCALFLISIKKEQVKEQDEEEDSKWVADVLSRFFRETDLAGYLGHGIYTVFLVGSITGNAVYEKAAGLVQALEIAAGYNMDKAGQPVIGVYFTSAEEVDYAGLFRNADYALEMAKKEKKKHFYMHTSNDLQGRFLEYQEPPVSAQMMFRYIDEGVRIFELGDTLKLLYVSPGFYRRLSLDEEAARTAQIQIHPDDIEAYEKHVQEVSRSGMPQNSYYRVSVDGKNWIPCRIRLLRALSESDEQKNIIIEISHNISGLEELKGRLDEKMAWLSFVADQTDYLLWEVDIKSKAFRMLYTHGLLEGRQTIYKDFPESLIESGRIHSGSAEDFRGFARELLGGRMQGSGNFRIQYLRTSCYGWATLSYRMLCDENGRPIKAIGITEELSYLSGYPSRSAQRRPIPTDLYSDLYCYLQANLTMDTVEELLLEGRERVHLVQYQKYGKVTDQGVSRVFSDGDVKRIQRKFSRDQLLREFEIGRYWSYDRCRIADLDGSIRWISVGVNLSRDPENGDVCLYAYLSRMDHRIDWEKKLREPVQTDQKTGIYMYSEWEKLVKTLLGRKKESSCVLMQICIEGADEIFSESSDGREIRNIVTALNVFLNTDCLIGWKDENNILVFFPDISTGTNMRSRIENVFSFARISLSEMYELRYLRLVAGGVFGGGNQSLEEMLYSAAVICAHHAGAAADIVELCQASEAYQWEEIGLRESLHRVEYKPSDFGNILTEKDKDIALECLGLMLKAGSARESLNGALARIGEYYQADRVYILMLTEEKQTMTMQNEWVRAGKYSIQQSISGKRVSDFPVIANYAKRPERVMLTSQKKKEEVWQYAIFPMDSGRDTEQMLCIENPKKYTDHMALIDKLLPYIGKEKKRFWKMQVNNSPLDRFYALPNMDECMNALYSIDSDRYSSLGVVMVDVPEYEKLKELRGFEYGREMLLHISNVFMEVFDKTQLFHTKEAEFLVLCTDVIYSAFLEHCARAKQMVGRQNKGLFRMGCTWSEGIFNARDLVKKARSIMECDDSWERSEVWLRPLVQENLTLEQDVMARLQTEGYPTIYLQPKIDMRDGHLMGAEALVRILDKDGKLLPHGRVIEEMEEDGTIHKVDYFVLDRLMSTMNHWQEKGYTMYPMSSNFSRNTLLNPSALASVLAIMSRYPLVSQDLIEIEITETAGDFENNTFEELIRRFEQYGLRFSLDDFGSGYSNMNMLAELKFHSVKLDRSLIKNITENSTSRMIVRDLVHICQSCNMICVAEGVENQNQVAVLLENGCVCGQGFYYDRPIPVEIFEEKYLKSPDMREVYR